MTCPKPCRLCSFRSSTEGLLQNLHEQIAERRRDLGEPVRHPRWYPHDVSLREMKRLTTVDLGASYLTGCGGPAADHRATDDERSAPAHDIKQVAFRGVYFHVRPVICRRLWSRSIPA